MALDSGTGSVRGVLSDLPIKVVRGLLIRDELHLFGFADGHEYRDAHLILDKQLERKQGYDRLLLFGDIGHRKRQISGTWSKRKVMYSESRNSCLSLASECVIGNIIYDIGYDVFVEYSMVTKQWKIRECEVLPRDMWPTYSGVVYSADGRYLVFFGGNVIIGDDGESEYTDRIFIYDLSQQAMKPKISSLCCPVKGNFGALSMREKKMEEVTTFGFVRR